VTSQSSDLSVDRVVEALAAGAFSAAISLPLDTLVTLDLAAMGIQDADEARRELHRFIKVMASWLNERRLPVVWIASIERGKGVNLHAHIAVHVPGNIKRRGEIVGIRYRTQFRRWAREAMARRVGRAVPRLVNVRCGLVQSNIAHWICVTYLLKSFDKAGELSPPSRAGRRVPLADIMPFPYRSAGDVPGRRLFISGNLGPARRKIGMPAGFEHMLPAKPNVLALEVVPRANAVVAERPHSWVAQPFVAAVEEGYFDVREIYGVEFAEFVTRTVRQAPEGDPAVLTVEQLLDHLERLGI
jgi:hypothetical protein